MIEGRFGRPRVTAGPRKHVLQRTQRERVRLTLLYCSFIYYVFVITTYQLPFADIAIAVGIIGLFLQPERIVLPQFLKWLFAFTIWCAVASGTAMDTAEAVDAVIAAAKLSVIALVMVNALRSPAQIRWLLGLFLAFFLTHPVRGALSNYLAGYTRMGRALWNHVFENPNDLAALCFLPLAAACALFVTSRSRWVRMLCLVGFGALPFTILLTQSRGAFIGFVAASAIGFAAVRHRPRTLVLSATLVGLLIALAPASVWERMSGITKLTSTATMAEADEEGSAEARLEVWKIAGTIVADHPLTGVGLGNYPIAHERYTGGNANEVFYGAAGRRDTHSTYINVLAETGWPGLIIFLCTIASAVRYAERVRRSLRTADRSASTAIWYIELGLLAYLIAAIWGTFGHAVFLYLHLGILWSLASAYDRWRGHPIRNKSVSGMVQSQRVAGTREAASRHPVGYVTSVGP